jgi:hypothetical protein
MCVSFLDWRALGSPIGARPVLLLWPEVGLTLAHQDGGGLPTPPSRVTQQL